jgi:hypothetical protein
MTAADISPAGRRVLSEKEMRLAFAALCFGLCALAGCAPVKSYQRELLALPAMSLQPTDEVAAEQHMLQAREASSGGYGAAGGGCGCN